MADGFDLIFRLTSAQLSTQEQERMFRDFARLLGWEPSNRLDADPDLKDITNGHLVVEHGLENSAVITFLKSPAVSLQPEQVTRILSISYNNLIDWHIYVEPDRVTYVFNRQYEPEARSRPLSRSNLDNLKSTMFDQITGAAPNPNFPALDHALVQNISYWKRNLAAELRGRPQSLGYSTLFNAVMFVRAAEDHERRLVGGDTQVLLDEWQSQPRMRGMLRAVLESSLKRFVNGNMPKGFLGLERLKVFDALSPDLIYDLLASFYKSRNVPYKYDFAIMSKHALSRIYERYVSLLRFDESSQLSFMPSLPREDYDKSYGSVYTPQFIARFFARFLRDETPPNSFRRLKTVDPACGSGIFLRTILELQCAPGSDGVSSEEIEFAFENAKGIDIDENATEATKLSLSLLYLVLMSGRLPRKLDIVIDDALAYFEEHPRLVSSRDVVVANPPFVASEYQSPATRKRVANFMGNLAAGKVDIYLAFLKIAIDVLKPGGYGLFVLPHSFLRNSSGQKVRALIHDAAWIRCLVDLSLIPVFSERGSYVVLLIFQKKSEAAEATAGKPKATIVRCNDLVGHALQDYLSGKRVENNLYSIFDVEQEAFSSAQWVILPPSEATIQSKLGKFKTIDEFLDVRQGMVTGADDVFIISKVRVPKGEGQVWVPLLKDREMQRYVVPKSSSSCAFYPIVEGKRLTKNQLATRFPQTWAYLQSNRAKLPQRKAEELNWWEPARMRDVTELLGPKILTPHLVVLPRFSLDSSGKYCVSRSPYLVSKRSGSEIDLLKFFLAILNSTIGAWLLSTHSDKYSRGYARLEVRTLRSIPVPDPTKVSAKELAVLIGFVDKKLAGDITAEMDQEIDRLVSDLYGLTYNDQLVLGFEGNNAAGNG